MADPGIALTPRTFSFSFPDIGISPRRVRLDPRTFRFTGSAITAGQPRTTTTETLGDANLPRPQRIFPWTDERGFNTVNTDAYLEKLLRAIEAAFGAQGGQIGENTRILAMITDVLNLSTQAVAKAEAVADAVALQNSYTNPASVISASSDGTVHIIDHQRVYDYADGTQTVVDVAGATIPSEYRNPESVTAYYDDAARAGGAVSYTVTNKAVAQTGARHIAGQVTIPASGAADETGTSPGAPGYDATQQYDPYGTYYAT